MKDPAPPRWMERILLRRLPARDRETISGDLLEEYREEQLPRLGSTGANFWYLRQALSFRSGRSFGGARMKTSLKWMSVFTAASGVWLAVMENILRHAGYGERTAVAALIAIQGLTTVLFLAMKGGPFLRGFILAGGGGALILGAWAVIRIVAAPHFEGFVLAIGSALIVQGVLTLLVVIRARERDDPAAL